MVNSSVPIVMLLSGFLSPILLLSSGSSTAALHCVSLGSQEGSHPAWWHWSTQRGHGRTGRYTLHTTRLPSFLTRIWPSSEPSTKGNYTTGPDCSCCYCFMAELLQHAPSLAFAHTGTPCSTSNHCRKGTLWEKNRLPSLIKVTFCLDFLAVPH